MAGGSGRSPLGLRELKQHTGVGHILVHCRSPLGLRELKLEGVIVEEIDLVSQPAWAA